MIVITAPTSQIGSQLIADLLAADLSLRLIAREPGKLPKDVRDRVEIIEGSHGDPEVIDRALSGAAALFWLAPPAWGQTLEQAYPDFTRACSRGDPPPRSGASRVRHRPWPRNPMAE